MKKIIVITALALVAGAAFNSIEAKKKKVVATTPVVTPVVLTTGSDSLSYAAGMAVTNGLVAYLTAQEGIDTAYIADFIRGFKEAIDSAVTPAQKAYAAGLDIANQVQTRMLPGMTQEFTDTPDTIIKAVLYRGFTDALQGDTTHFNQAAAEAFFQGKQQSNKAAKEERLYGPNRDAGIKFLEENAKKDGVIVTPSGLQYKVLVQGDGQVPQASDKVMVNYEGRLIDGTVFDASAKHGDKPAEFTPTQVIRGWTEALTMMPVGSKWQLYIPQELAYGERNAGQIKPYSALIFDVELVGIVGQPTEAPAAEKKTTGAKAKKAKK